VAAAMIPFTFAAVAAAAIVVTGLLIALNNKKTEQGKIVHKITNNKNKITKHQENIGKFDNKIKDIVKNLD
jgi:peptidoglycan hydrolase CwlO-like protein